MNHIYGDENPYQPPKAEMVVPNHPVNRPAKPASSWILMVAFAAVAASWWIKQQVYSKEFGVSTFGLNFGTIIALLCVVSLLVLLLGSRQRWAYLMVISVLAVLVSINLVNLFSDLSQPVAIKDLIVIIPLMALRLWLYYRFTFGLPSRRYYGMASVSQD